MTPGAVPAGPAPIAPQPGDDRDLADRIVAEPAAADDADLQDAFRGLAALMLDIVAARPVAESRGLIPTPGAPSPRPNGRRRPRRFAVTAGVAIR